MRGAQNNFKPYEQVRSRVEQLEAIGHTVDKIDLIVMGTHGRTGLAHLMKGSVAEKVLRKTLRPVMVIPLGK